MARPKRVRNFLKVRDDAPAKDLGRLVAEDDDSLDLYYVEPERYVDGAQSFDDPVIFFMSVCLAASIVIVATSPLLLTGCANAPEELAARLSQSIADGLSSTVSSLMEAAILAIAI